MTAVSDPPSATVVLDGEIDIATAPAIRRILLAAISGGNVQLAVNMSGVTFIDAAGIGVLVAAANRARQAEGGLSLLAPSRQVRRLAGRLAPGRDLADGPAPSRPPSPPVAPPDASPGLPQDEGRCDFQAAASRLRSCFVPGLALAASRGAGVPFGGADFTVEGGPSGFLPQGCSFRAVAAVLCTRTCGETSRDARGGQQRAPRIAPRRQGKAHVWRHGNYPVDHRSPEAAARCRNR